MLSFRKSFTLLAVSAAVMAPLSAFSWIDTGHMIVSAIAAKNLKPGVRAKIDALLKTGGDDRSQDFYGAASWADDTKTRENGMWHYIDYYFRSDGKPAVNKPDEQNVVWAINKFSAVLADKSASEADRADALRYVIHFVGDIHQPLHATSRESDAMPKGDAGGNRFKIGPVDGIKSTHPNLHLLWDFACTFYVSVPRPLTVEGKAQIDAYAAQIMADYPKKSLKNVKDLNPDDWAQESFGIAKAVVYNLDEGTTPSAEYIAKGKKVSEERLALAGYRLAELLNKLLA